MNKKNLERKMNKGNKILIISIIVIFLAIILILTLGNNSKNNAKVTNPINSSSIDCKKDIDCFIEASKTCTPAIWTNQYGLGFQITGKVGKKCNVYIEFVNGDCPYEQERLTSILENWKKGNWNDEDHDICNQTSQITTN